MFIYLTLNQGRPDQVLIALILNVDANKRKKFNSSFLLQICTDTKIRT